MEYKTFRQMKVIMIGPGSGIMSGISTLIDTILPSLNSQVQVYYFPTISNRPLNKSGKLSLRNLITAVEQFSRFYRTIQKFTPHIVHIHTSQGIAWLKDTIFAWMGRLVKSRIVIHFHITDFSRLYTKQPGLFKAYTRYVLAKADTVIVTSKKCKNDLCAFTAEQKIHILPNCVQSSGEQIPHSVDRKVSNALFLGSIGPQKGVFDMIDAVSRLSVNGHNVHFWVAGYEERDGDYQIAREKIAEYQIDGRCELVGEISGKTKQKYLKEMDFLVLPSHNEGMPMVILEALAEGRPVISTHVGGIPEMIKEGYNGFLVEPGDTRALADRMSTLIDHPDLCNQMGINGLNLVKKSIVCNLMSTS